MSIYGNNHYPCDYPTQPAWEEEDGGARFFTCLLINKHARDAQACQAACSGLGIDDLLCLQPREWVALLEVLVPEHRVAWSELQPALAPLEFRTRPNMDKAESTEAASLSACGPGEPSRKVITL